eukprot:CAMPEP_0197081398 /NCGR_PEP_ID=MMETSP1384-20130603/214613_1 /TAXON_ID=29189 /ORGANISM="Ammonia sp." /LENGTH=768 /DNA_ID=CAMNT_0042520293 /DNA_START=17 /DNA_END=2324 /DNA_ORIENTATION=-
MNTQNSPRAVPPLSSPKSKRSSSPITKPSASSKPIPSLIANDQFDAHQKHDTSLSSPPRTNSDVSLPPPPPPELAPLSSPPASIPPSTATKSTNNATSSKEAETDTKEQEKDNKQMSDEDKFKDLQLPQGWMHAPIEFTQPFRDHRILVCKTPISQEIATHFAIPKEKWFLPHTVYTLPSKQKERKVGLVIDLTNQRFYDEASFNHGKKNNKVKLRVIPIENARNPTRIETELFVRGLRLFEDGAQNQDKWVVVFDELGYNLAGYMCAAYMVDTYNQAVDAAVYTFGSARKPGIYDSNYIRLLHQMYSDEEDLEIFETTLKIKPLQKPSFLQPRIKSIRSPISPSSAIRKSPKTIALSPTTSGKPSEFAVPTTSLTRKRSFSEMRNSSGSDSDGSIHHNHSSNTNTSSSLIEEPSLLCEPQIIEPVDMNGNPNNSDMNSISSSSTIIEEPTLIEPLEPTLMEQQSSSSTIIEEPTLIEPLEPTLMGNAYQISEPPQKRQRTMTENVPQVHVPAELKQDHPYLVAVRDQHLQNLTSIALQLSKTKEYFQSIQDKPVTVPIASMMAIKEKYRISWLGKGYHFWLMTMMAIKEKYRISWLGKGYHFWLMILGKKGSFFVDPSYFTTGKLGGIYHIEGTVFHDANSNKYLDGTLCCGELVVDHIKDKHGGQMRKVPRFLITDLLVIEKSSLSKFPHTQRLLQAENVLYKPFAKSLTSSKLRIRVKPMYGIENEEIVQKLQRMITNELPHQCDGLGLFAINPPFGQRRLRIAI